MGGFYYEGLGIEKNYEQAYLWWKKSAEQEFAPAQANLGYCYMEGVGTNSDMQLAFKFSELAAIAGDATGQYNLAEIYKDGSEAVPQNLDNALHWFSLSAEQGIDDAIEEREKLLKLHK